MLLCFILYRGWNHIIDVSKNHLYEFLSTINLNFSDSVRRQSNQTQPDCPTLRHSRSKTHPQHKHLKPSVKIVDACQNHRNSRAASDVQVTLYGDVYY